MNLFTSYKEFVYIDVHQFQRGSSPSQVQVQRGSSPSPKRFESKSKSKSK